MKKTWRYVAVLALVLAACQPGPATSTNVPTELVMAVIPAYEVALQEVADRYTAQTGTRVRINVLPSSGYQEALTTALTGRSTAFDALYIQDPWLPAFAAAGLLEPFDQYLPVDDRRKLEADLFPIAMQAASYQGKLYGLPLEFGSMYLFYRKDLIPTPPKDTDEYLALAREFTKTINPNSPTQYGTSLQGTPQRLNYQEWYSFLWSFGGDIFDANFKPTINSPAAIAALEWRYGLRTIHKVVPPDVTNYGFPETTTALQQELVPMAIQWNSGYPILTDATKSPKVFDKLGIAPIPGKRQPDGSVKQVNFAKAWVMAVNPYSTKKAETAKFLTWFAGPEAGKLHLHAGSVTSSQSALKDKEVQTKRKDSQQLLDTLSRAQITPHIPEMPQVEALLAPALSQVLAGQTSAKEALDSVARDAEVILRKSGRLK